MKRYPFKFLDAYKREDLPFFFGREEEVDMLYEMVFQADLMLVYGASGTGKTSLIQCGLAGKFESHEWLALNIRRGNNLNTSFEKALIAAGGLDTPTDEAVPNLDWLDEDLSTDISKPATGKKLSPLARRFRSIYLQHFKPLYLIFDQFEELYILGNKEEQRQFIQTIKEMLLVEQPVKVIISIREEYLGYLYEFEREVPQLLRKKLRVEPMNLDKVKSVIKGVGEQSQSIIKLQPGEEDAIAEGVFDKIRGAEKTLSIQLPYLQVFLDKLYLQITGDASRQQEAVFTLQGLKQMGDIGDVLRDFLDDQVFEIAQKLEKPTEDIWAVLSPFVTLEGTKEPLGASALYRDLPTISNDLADQILTALTRRRILRFTEEEQLYEIAHDSLAKQIHERRSDEEIAILEVRRLIKSQLSLSPEAREFFTEKQLLFIDPYLQKFQPTVAESEWIEKSRVEVEKQKQAEAERQKRELEAAKKAARRQRFFLILVSIVALAAIGASFLAIQQSKEVNKRNREILERSYANNLATAESLRNTRNFELALAQLDSAKSSATEIGKSNSLALMTDQWQAMFALIDQADTLKSDGQLYQALQKLGEAIDMDTSFVLISTENKRLKTEIDQEYELLMSSARSQEALLGGINPIICDLYQKAARLKPNNELVLQKLKACQ